MHWSSFLPEGNPPLTCPALPTSCKWGQWELGQGFPEQWLPLPRAWHSGCVRLPTVFVRVS